MPEITAPERRLLLSVDMEHYSRRDNQLQYRAQQALRQVVDRGIDELGLDRATWRTQQSGDGELAVLPAGTPEVLVVTRLASTLDRLLRGHNCGLAPQARIRLRIAMHEGLVHLDGATGYAGQAAVTVCRLVDAPPLKSALGTFPEANVALIISDRIYQDIICQYQDLRADRFYQVLVKMPDKRFREQAWVFVPDEDATRMSTHPAVSVATRPGSHEGGSADLAPDDARTSLPASLVGGGQVYSNIRTNGPAALGNHNQVNG